jgi:hypothetical protein
MVVSLLYKHRRPGISRSSVVNILVLLNLSISGPNYRALTKRPDVFSVSLSLFHTHTPLFVLILTERFEEMFHENFSKNRFAY